MGRVCVALPYLCFVFLLFGISFPVEQFISKCQVGIFILTVGREKSQRRLYSLELCGGRSGCNEWSVAERIADTCVA
jgi:hypothetical protein